MIDIKTIREAAEAATPGPWVLGTSGDERFSRVHHYVEDCVPKWDELLLENVPTLILYDIQAENAKHIATANPATVLALCDEVERLTACIKKANDQAEHFEREWYLRGDEIDNQAGLIKALEAQVANQQKHLLRQDAELERLRKEVEADERNLCQLTDELAESRREVERLRKDAERYRLIRDADMNFRNRAEHYSWLALDEFLDAAMEVK